MELRQLRYFIAVAEEGHFGRAAERVRVAQPGLSQQIKALERSVGAELVDRQPRPVRLTPAGERLLPLARSIVETAARTRDVAREARPADALRLAVPSTSHFPELAKVVARFRERAPKIELEVIPSSNRATVEAIARRTIDIGVVYVPFDWAEPGEAPRFVPLGRRELLIALPPAHPLATDGDIPRSALLREPFLDRSDASCPALVGHIRRLLFGGAEHPRRIEILHGVDESKLDLVRKGRGLTVCAVATGCDLPPPADGIAYRRVEEPRPMLEYGLLWVEPNASPATGAFVASVLDEVAASA